MIYKNTVENYLFVTVPVIRSGNKEICVRNKGSRCDSILNIYTLNFIVNCTPHNGYHVHHRIKTFILHHPISIKDNIQHAKCQICQVHGVHWECTEKPRQVPGPNQWYRRCRWWYRGVIRGYSQIAKDWRIMLTSGDGASL